MSEYILKNSNILRSIYVPPDLDIELKKLAAEKGTDKSSLYRIGAKLLLAIIEYGAIPKCVIELLASQGKKELLEDLQEVIGDVEVGE
jgi:hypothetical protein